MPLKEMSASEIGMEELLPQKRCQKNNFNLLAHVKKRIVLVELKKLSEELNTGISLYLINTKLLIADS